MINIAKKINNAYIMVRGSLKLSIDLHETAALITLRNQRDKVVGQVAVKPIVVKKLIYDFKNNKVKLKVLGDKEMLI